MSELLILCWEFFKTGLFAVGGGLATLPFLTQMSIDHPHWFSQEMLADMVAVSEATPGPVGVNMATYVGYTVAGIPGALLATFSLILPSVIIILLVAKALQKFKENKLVQDAFFGLRPAVTGLIAAAGFSVLAMALVSNGAYSLFGLLDWRACLLFFVLLAASQIKPLKKLHPIVYIGVSAVVGVVFGL